MSNNTKLLSSSYNVLLKDLDDKYFNRLLWDKLNHYKKSSFSLGDKEEEIFDFGDVKLVVEPLPLGSRVREPITREIEFRLNGNKLIIEESIIPDDILPYVVERRTSMPEREDDYIRAIVQFHQLLIELNHGQLVLDSYAEMTDSEKAGWVAKLKESFHKDLEEIKRNKHQLVDIDVLDAYQKAMYGIMHARDKVDIEHGDDIPVWSKHGGDLNADSIAYGKTSISYKKDAFRHHLQSAMNRYSPWFEFKSKDLDIEIDEKGGIAFIRYLSDEIYINTSNEKMRVADVEDDITKYDAYLRYVNAIKQTTIKYLTTLKTGII